MSLEQLVDHFNTKFTQEHQCDFRPFLLKQNSVTAIFGIAHLKSEFSPIRVVFDTDLIAGYAVKLITSNNTVKPIKSVKIKKLLEKTLNKPAHVPSIITFDRLCRTMHLLNYRALANQHNFLIADVDPRHILGVPYNHGAYFEQVIIQAGLKTQNVIISMSTTGTHQLHYPQLLKGLNNYRECGYKIALNIGYMISADKTINLIKQLRPDYIIVKTPNENYLELTGHSVLLSSLTYLRGLMTYLGGKIIMQQVESPEQIFIANKVGCDLIQGNELTNILQIEETRNCSYHTPKYNQYCEIM